jgi:hypothetical protein
MQSAALSAQRVHERRDGVIVEGIAGDREGKREDDDDDAYKY